MLISASIMLDCRRLDWQQVAIASLGHKFMLAMKQATAWKRLQMRTRVLSRLSHNQTGSCERVLINLLAFWTQGRLAWDKFVLAPFPAFLEVDRCCGYEQRASRSRGAGWFRESRIGPWPSCLSIHSLLTVPPLLRRRATSATKKATPLPPSTLALLHTTSSPDRCIPLPPLPLRSKQFRMSVLPA